MWRQAEELRRAELAAVQEELADTERERLERITASLVRKLLHGPSERLRAAAGTPGAAAHVDTFGLLFDAPTPEGGADVVALPRRDAAA